MTRNEFRKKVEKGSDIEFEVNGIGCTICTWTENGISIGEWDRPETVSVYETVDEMIDNYIVRGVPLVDLMESVKITDYTANS